MSEIRRNSGPATKKTAHSCQHDKEYPAAWEATASKVQLTSAPSIDAIKKGLWSISNALDVCSNSNLISTIEAWTDWNAYPKSWPTATRMSLPKGLVKLDDGIKKSAARRLATIRKDLKEAGPHYPRETVCAALSYWKIEI
jgi:hypothetical protein